MKKKRMVKRVFAVVLALALLCGTVPAVSAFLRSAAAEDTPATKFIADFSELGTLLEGTAMKDSLDNTHYETAYTPVGDISTLDGKINTWMREKFASTTNHAYSSTRAWFAQKSDEISDAEADGWGKNGKLTGFALLPGGYLRLRVSNVSGANMMRRVDTIIPQFNGENVKLKNFKMTVKYLTYLQDYRGAITVSFDETKAGSIVGEPNVYGEIGYRKRVTGSTLVLGNGTGMELSAANDGWVFYNKKDLISATTVDEQHHTDAALEWKELKPGSDYTIENGDVVYERFDTASSQQWMTLTVEVKNGKATFTVVSEDGTRNETMEMAYAPRGGYVSIGMSNRDYVISYVDIEEYDDNGNAVDYGTYHNKVNYGVDGAVEVFSADFTDLPDVNYVNGSYLYNTNHDTATGKGVGLTAEGSTTATPVGATAATYTVNIKDKALVDYLESKFDFYTYGNNGGGTFEMWNAAGYVVDAEGNALGAGFANAAHNPATGVQGGGYMPGSGQGGYWYGGMYPTQKLSENKWLHIAADIGVNSMNPFDVVYSYALQNADGDKAVVKNFKLDLDFKLTHPGYGSYAHNQSPVFIKFGGYDSVKNGCTDGAMFSISHNGGYFLGDLDGGFTGSKNSDNSPAYTEYIGGAAATQKVGEAHLTLTVKNGTVNAVVTLTDGTKVLDVTKSDINIQSGLIYIGTTYAGMNHGLPYFGAVQVVRLDNDGNPVDFTDGDEDTFNASFVGLTDVIDTCYYRNLGTKNNSILTGKSNIWLTNAVGIAEIRNKENRGYAFDENDPHIVNYLNEKFDFYHAASDGTLTKMSSPYQNADEIYLDTSWSGGQWKLAGGRWLRATFTNGVYWQDAFRKQMILVPKLGGNAVKTTDQHLEFDYAHGITDNECSYSAALVMLRSDEIAKTKSAAGDYTNGIAIRITHLGISVYDGTSPANTHGHTGDDQFLYGGDIYEAHVSIDLEGDQLKLKVTSLDGATVYTDETVTVTNRLMEGYTYFSVCNSDMAFADIELQPLYADNFAAVPTGLVAQDGTVFGLDARYAYEYRQQGKDEWISVEPGSTQITGLKTNCAYEVRFAAGETHSAGAAFVVDLCSYDVENTVQYRFDEATELNDFDTWFVPTVVYNKDAVSTTGTTNTNWYIENGVLKYKGSSYNNDPGAYQSGVEIEGQTWKCSYASVYNSNMGIAVLKNKQYKNFILDFDFTGSPYWTTVGFGAENTADGVYWTNQSGGYSMFLESNGAKGSTNFYYMTAEGLKTQNAPSYFDYDNTKQHHMRVTVTNGKAYMSVDDQPAFVVDVPAEYDGGYIFFALNNTTTAIDNVQVIDLDVKEIVIKELVKPIATEIDRAAGKTINNVTTVVAYGLTTEGYECAFMVEPTVDETYRSYKDTTFNFEATLKAMKNVSIANGVDLTVSVVNKVDYDATISRKYYFDHENDLKDFSGYYSKPETSEGYWSNANDTGSEEEKNRKWSAYDGELVSMDGADRQWVIRNNALITNYWGGNGNASAVAYMRNLSTLMYNGHTLTNFRMEYDVKKGASSWWYNYSVIGVQDPTQYVYQLHKYSASLSTGEETSNQKHDGTKDAGVYAFLEQEGYFNIFGNVMGGSDRVNTDAVTLDGDAYVFIQNYDKDAWHHITIEVVNGIMKWTVDDSFTLYYELDYNAIGGYVGLGTYGTYSQFDNFQLTALDAEGNAVNMDTAEQSGAKPKEVIEKPTAWLPSFKFSWS